MGPERGERLRERDMITKTTTLQDVPSFHLFARDLQYGHSIQRLHKLPDLGGAPLHAIDDVLAERRLSGLHAANQLLDDGLGMGTGDV